MKVTFAVRGTVTYVGDTTMSKKEYDEWCSKFDRARGFEQGQLCATLVEKAGLDLGDPSDWGELELDTFERVKS